jgi:hypothetical protein
MRDRTDHPTRAASRSAAFTVDPVIVTPLLHGLGVLTVRGTGARGRDSWELPWSAPRRHESLESAARRLVRAHAGADATWMEQVGAFADAQRHPSGAPLSICYIAVVPAGTTPPSAESVSWIESDRPASLGARQRAMMESALTALRWRMDYAPIPFRLLPAHFTLTDLQQMYELLLGRRLHKASFRRALHASWLVEPTDEWRSEGRGRPAQLFRYAPRKRRGYRRGVRFDLLPA